jgi:hypothetical protein
MVYTVLRKNNVKGKFRLKIEARKVGRGMEELNSFLVELVWNIALFEPRLPFGRA